MTGRTSSDYKKRFSLEKREAEARRALENHADRIPCIIEKAQGATLESIDKNKYLIPADLSVSQMYYIIRERVSLQPEDAMFLFVNNTVPPASQLMSDLYKEHKDLDGFLYIKYHNESIFGA